MAQQYPSTPYGVQYPPATSFYPPFPQQGMPQPSQTPPVYPQSSPYPPPGYPIPPAANLTRYDANTQIRTPGQTFPFPPAQFAPDMFKQFANSNIPLPPPPNFPPVPIPGYGSQSFLPATNTTLSPFPQSTPLNAPDLQDAAEYDPHFPQSVSAQNRTENPFAARTKSAAVETIRFTNQGYGAPSSSSRFQPEPLLFQSQTEHQPKEQSHVHSRSQLPKSFFTTNPEFPYKQPEYTSKMMEGESTNMHINNERPGSRSSYKPASPNASQSKDPLENNTSSVLQEQYTDMRDNLYHGKSVGELKELAKGALLSLIPHNIQYTDLLKEGVDAHLLDQLYDELGLTVPSQESPKRPDMGEVAATPDVNDTQPIPLQEKPATDAISGPGKLAEDVPLSASTTAPNTGLERKDRIAQLLAAKAGRANAVRSPTASVSVENVASGSSTNERNSATKVINKQQHQSSSEEQNPETHENVDNQLVSKTVKILKKDHKTESKPVVAAIETSTASRPLQRQAAVGQAIDVSQLNTPAKEALIRGGFGALIPGLFMTSSDPMIQQLDPMSGQQDTSAGLLETFQADEQTNGSKHIRAQGSVRVEAPLEQLYTNIDDRVMADAVTAADATDDASEGEIVEDGETDEPLGTLPSEARSGQLSQSTRSDQTQLRKAAETTTSQQHNTEMEQRQQRKRGHSQIDSPSSVDAPSSSQVVNNAGTALSKVFSPDTSSKDEASSPQSRPSAVRTVAKLTPAQLAEKAAQLKAEFLRQRAQRAQRQQALQDGLPVLDIEVQKTQSRLVAKEEELVQIRNQKATYHAQYQKAESREAELVIEIGQLKVQFSQGRAGQQQYSTELNNLNADQKESQRPHFKAAAEEIMIDTAPAVLKQDLIEQSLSTESQLQSESEQTEDANSMSGAAEAQVPDPHAGTQSEIDNEASLVESETDVPMDEDLPSEYGESRLQVSAGSSDQASTSHISPVAEHNTAGIEDETDGSASMSDSGPEMEEEYEPADVDSNYSMEMDDAESDDYDPEDESVAPTQTANHIDEDDGDDYEPAEEQEILDTPLTSMSEGAISEANNELVHQHQPVAEQEPSVPESKQEIREPHVEPPKAEDTIVTQQNAFETPNLSALSGTRHPRTEFMPYQSPLSAFKSFRYNPQFDTAAREGYRSLTYSNNIDPKQPLCSTELLGEICTDPACEEQHFRHLGLSDDKILVQMSSASDIQDKALREKYLLGLKQVIAELRQQGVKEFENVAAALSAYRRKFYDEQEAV